MAVTDRELWVVNFYRNSELHGALLMGRLARTLADPDMLVHATRHCATEARHAALLTELIDAVGGRVDPAVETVQQRYSVRGGVPGTLVDVLVLSEVLERRVLVTYRAHVARADVHPAVKQTLLEILHDMEQEDHGDDGGWIERTLETSPPEQVETARRRWTAIDREVVAELEQMVARRFAGADAQP
jgi:hypothetical protein